MSRKQLYTYFERCPALRSLWDTTVSQARRANPAVVPVDVEAALRRRVRELEAEVQRWRGLAVLARADAEIPMPRADHEHLGNLRPTH